MHFEGKRPRKFDGIEAAEALYGGLRARHQEGRAEISEAQPTRLANTPAVCARTLDPDDALRLLALLRALAHNYRPTSAESEAFLKGKVAAHELKNQPAEVIRGFIMGLEEAMHE